MKIQCSCGAKFSFDVTPQMMQGPVHFVCSSCGLDASEYVTNLVREQFATSPPPTPEPPPAPVAHAGPTS